MSGSSQSKGKPMLMPTLLMGAIAVVLTLLAVYKDDVSHMAGFEATWSMIISILPMLLFAFLVAGMLQVLIPQSLVQTWLGDESGLRGILIGSLAGGFTPGGPYVSLPIAMVLVKSGAGAGTIIAFLTGWSLYAFGRLPMEVGILGWRLTLLRLASVLLFPPLAGLLARVLVRRFGGI